MKYLTSWEDKIRQSKQNNWSGRPVRFPMATFMRTYQAHLHLNIISESFHCNTSHSHCIANHHAWNRDDVPRSERKNPQNKKYEHRHWSSSQNGGSCSILSVRDVFGTLTSRITSNRDLQGAGAQWNNPNFYKTLANTCKQLINSHKRVISLFLRMLITLNKFILKF